MPKKGVLYTRLANTGCPIFLTPGAYVTEFLWEWEFVAFIRHCLSIEIVIVLQNFISQTGESQFLCNCDAIKHNFTISCITYHVGLSVTPFLSSDVRNSSVDSIFLNNTKKAIHFSN